MENYVLQSGRRGFKSYGRLWEKAYKGMTAEELDMVNQAREKLVEIIRPLREELKKKKATVREYTKAVYQFVNEYRFHSFGVLWADCSALVV